jgi:hypothetical protein
MSEPYTIRIFVPDGDPEEAKIIELMNWTGVGVAFPRSGWSRLSGRAEFKRSGVYVLTGAAEGTNDELPTVYIGQGEEIGARIENQLEVMVAGDDDAFVFHRASPEHPVG